MKKIIILIISLCISVMLFAQPNEVTLMVSGEGANKTEATNNALRSAIEQTFGAFVSSNSTILNDQIIKDEIITISSGNVKKYSELGTMDLPNGMVSVTLNATVSVENLVTYAQSKGVTCDFAGATFGANLRMIELNKKNSEQALNNLYSQLQLITTDLFDYDLIISDPKANGDIDVEIKVIPNHNYHIAVNYIKSIFSAILFDYSLASYYEEIGIKTYNYIIPIDEDWSERLQGYHFGWKREKDQKYSLVPLTQEINSLIAPPTIIQITDNLGNIYPIDFKIKNKISIPYGQTNLFSERLKEYKQSFGLEQGVTLLSDYEREEKLRHEGYFFVFYGYILLQDNPMFDIKTTINIPIETLTKINSFSISANPEDFHKTASKEE